MIISIDFDETIVRGDFPNIDELIPKAKEVISYWYSRGHEIIIDSCRTGDVERQMRGFLKYNDIPFDWLNKNSPRRIRKYKTDTRKISCDLSIDDKNLFIQSDMWFNGADVVQDSLWYTADQLMMSMERPLIICIVGESGVGKTMVAEYFEYEYGVNLIQSYTDRNKRFEGETGHKFVSPDRMDNLLLGDTIAETTYSEKGKPKARYCCLLDDVDRVNTYIITEDGLKQLQENWDDVFDIYSIRIKRDYDKRLEAAGIDRVARDEGRFTLPDSEYDFIINNVIEEKEYVYEQVREFVKKFRFKNRFEDYIPIADDELDEID